MANWYGTARSNYFKVKDEVAFRAWAASLNLQIFDKSPDTELAGMFAVAPSDSSDSGSWPSVRVDDDGCEDEDEEADLVSELATHLVPGQIAVLMEVGAEKLRYVTGNAVAVDSEGTVETLDLHHIYEMAAKKFGVAVDTITQCEY